MTTRFPVTTLVRGAVAALAIAAGLYGCAGAPATRRMTPR